MLPTFKYFSRINLETRWDIKPNYRNSKYWRKALTYVAEDKIFEWLGDDDSEPTNIFAMHRNPTEKFRFSMKWRDFYNYKTRNNYKYSFD